jgi:hypothetical protein
MSLGQLMKKKSLYHRPKKYNFGFRAIPLLALMSLMILSFFVEQRINYEIQNPTMSTYIINVLKNYPYFFVYVLPLLALFIFVYDYQQEGAVNVMGFLAGLFLILSFATGFTSFLSYLVGIILLAFSSI